MSRGLECGGEQNKLAVLLGVPSGPLKNKLLRRVSELAKEFIYLRGSLPVATLTEFHSFIFPIKYLGILVCADGF